MNESLTGSTSMPSSSYPNYYDGTWQEPVSNDVPRAFGIALILVGTIGNVLVCLAIFFDKKLQHATNFFLVSLAVADLLINVLILPARLAIDAYVLEPSSYFWCFLYLSGDDYLTIASSMHICIISLERFLAIRKPLSTRNTSNRRIYVKIGLVWLISFLMISPYAVLVSAKVPNRPLYCFNILGSSTNIFLVAYIMEVFLISIMLVVVVVSFIGTSIILHKKAMKQWAGGTGNGSGLVRTVGGNKSENSLKSQQLNSEKKAIRVVWLVSFAFIVTMTPYAAIGLTYLFAPWFVVRSITSKAITCLQYGNSVINPILYTIFNKQFRDNFKNIILFRWKSSSEIK